MFAHSLGKAQRSTRTGGHVVDADCALVSAALAVRTVEPRSQSARRLKPQATVAKPAQVGFIGRCRMMFSTTMMVQRTAPEYQQPRRGFHLR